MIRISNVFPVAGRMAAQSTAKADAVDRYPIQHHVDLSSHMLTDKFRFLAPYNIEHGLADRLRSLARDLERIRDGSAPTPAELAQAPLVDRWRALVTPHGLRLRGVVSDHRRLGGGATALISQLWAADSNGRWVRTLSRFYRLGKPNLGVEAGWDETEEPRDV
jgi:hypothetical protein